ncbi:MAG: hypothetical protein L0I24_08960 [Pseudonocardia sp.]|nr:hypothetical protein [Pseudonocardia sp.]
MSLLVGVCAERSDVSAYVRGKLWMGGVTHNTPIGVALDVLQVAIMDVPVEELEKWRRQFNHQVWRVRPPDRSTWGLVGDQRAQMGRLAGRGGAPRPGQAPGPSRGTRGSPAPRGRP